MGIQITHKKNSDNLAQYYSKSVYDPKNNDKYKYIYIDINIIL